MGTARATSVIYCSLIAVTISLEASYHSQIGGKKCFKNKVLSKKGPKILKI